MENSNQFLDKFLEDFLAWAQGIDDCRSIILFGSMAREIHRGDKYSDRDILVYSRDADSHRYIEWMRQYAPLWMVIKEPNTLWLIVYHAGNSVHISIDPLEDLQEIVAKQELSFDMKDAYKVLLDKDELAVKLPPVSSPVYEPPTEAEFKECVQNFFYGTTLIAKQLKRNNLWKAQWGNSIERNFLLTMLEWHTQAFADVKTWNRGDFMQEWVSAETWQALHEIVGRFDAEDSWRALFSSIDLFRKLARETADKLDYSLPDKLIDEIILYLEALHSGKK